MSDFQYLKDEQYYIDLSDLLTIKACLQVVEFWRKMYKEKSNEKEIKDLPEEEKIKGFQYYLNMELLVNTTNEWNRKKERIQKWMEDDRKEQDKHDNTPPPRNIICDTCKIPMQSTYKHVENYLDKPLRVLFFFDCSKCKKRKAVYEDGEEDISKPSLCPKCKKEVKESHKRKGNVITWTTKCSHCGFTKTDIDNLDKHKAEREQREKEDKELLEKYRAEFCLTDEKGQENVELFEKMKYANKVREEEMKKYDNPIYQRSLQLKKIEIVELEKLLTEVLEKEQYIKLSFDKPEIGQYVIVPFTVQDSNSKRKGFESSNYLQNLMRTTLEDTNWRLVSNSSSYRLGYVSGQLKGYEQEEDMMELAGKKKQQAQVKSTFEINSKYEYDPMVQFARMAGKQAAIENLRKQRLAEEPHGFFLDSSEEPLTCAICGETTPGNNIWWTEDAIRCADCWRNIQEKVIPPLTWDHDNKIWIKDWQFRSDYSIHGSTRKKLEKEGVLKGRQLKRLDGSIYCTVYLVKENEEFFKKYPKKPYMKIEFINTEKGKVQM